MKLSHYERTATGIRLHDVDRSHIDIVADDALTLLAYLLRDKAKLTETADAAALRKARAARQPMYQRYKNKVSLSEAEKNKENGEPETNA